MGCDVTDFRCVFVNELVGDPTLAVILLGIVFFAISVKERWGMRTTLWFGCVYFPIVSYFIAGTSFIFAIITLIASLLLALLHARLIGNR